MAQRNLGKTGVPKGFEREERKQTTSTHPPNWSGSLTKPQFLSLQEQSRVTLVRPALRPGPFFSLPIHHDRKVNGSLGLGSHSLWGFQNVWLSHEKEQTLYGTSYQRLAIGMRELCLTSAGEPVVTSGLHSECPALSTPSRGISYDRVTKTVLHSSVILGPSLMFQKLILFEATVRWIGLLFEVPINTYQEKPAPDTCFWLSTIQFKDGKEQERGRGSCETKMGGWIQMQIMTGL